MSVLGFAIELAQRRTGAAAPPPPEAAIVSLVVGDATPIDPDGGGIGIAGDGWTAQIRLPLIAGAAFDPEKLTLTVADPGYDTAGAATVRTRQIHGTRILRRQYPNAAERLAGDDGATATVTIALSDLIYAGSTVVSVDCAAGYYGAAAAGAVAGGAIVNASTRAYYKPLFAWLNLQQERATGAGFAVEGVAYHRHAMNGQQVACVAYTGSDGTHTAAPQVCGAPALSDIQTSGNIVEAWKASVPLAALDQGTLSTVNARVYPWIGDASAVLDLAADGVAWPTANPQTPLRFLCDKTGGYGGLEAWVKAGVSGGAVGSRSTPYPTLIAALAGLAAANNATKGHNDHSGSTVWLMDDGAGGAVDHGIAGDIATAAGLCWTTIAVDPLATGAVRLSVGNGASRTFAGLGLYRFACPVVQLTSHNLNGGSDVNSAMLAFDGPFDGNGGTVTPLNYRVGLIWMRNGTLTGMTNGNANPLASIGVARREQVVLALGLSWAPGVNMAIAAFTTIGCRFSRVTPGEHQTSFAQWDSDDGRIFANNRCLDMRSPALFGDKRAYQRGLALVQNVFERANVANAPALQIGADGSVAALDNLLIAYGTVPGDATENRTNWCYADAAGAAGVIRRGVALYSIFAEYNCKSDSFTTVSTATGRVGNHELLYTVGGRGNVCVNGSTGGSRVPGVPEASDNWLGEYWETGSLPAGAVIGFVQMRAGGAAAGGGGDYRLTGETNAAYARVPAGLAGLRFALDGAARRNDGTGAAGAYERS
ncbi:hypothetical protein ACMT1E_11250 [Sphingomonas flavalba]|uniref:hypothetical protein n=1 Tax=Sphingomonas flavalba TaxID=2559804 RepID=UPI0039E00FD3